MTRSLVLAALLLAAAAGAHDQPVPSATIAIGRDGTVRTTLRLSLVHTLWRTTAPNSSFADFMTRTASLDDAALGATYRRFQIDFAAGTRLSTHGTPVRLGAWTWPATAQLRAAILEILPAALQEPDPREITFALADIRILAKASPRITELDLDLPRGIDPIDPEILTADPPAGPRPKP